MKRVLLLFRATSYRPDAYVKAARELGLEAVLATDMASAARHLQAELHQLDLGAGEAEAQRLLAELSRPVHGVVAADEPSAVAAAEVAQLAGLPFHARQGVQAAQDKRLQRRLLSEAGVAVPEHWVLPPHEEIAAHNIELPCVVKPTMLSGSQGVMRADTAAALERAVAVARGIARHSDSPLRELDGFHHLLIERYVDGPEVALEGVVEHGELQQLALFDKPDPLCGPTFEETLYVTPSRHPPALQQRIFETTAAACRVLGLRHGPIHAELRLSTRGPVIIEVAARSIGGLCSQMLRRRVGSLERRLLRAAVGLTPESLVRDPPATGVMMIPVPKSGVLRHVSGLDQARALDGIDSVQIAIEPTEAVRKLPHGNRYLGFAFAHGASPAEVEQRLRDAHARLRFHLKPLLPTIC